MVWFVLGVVAALALAVWLRRSGDTERALEETVTLAYAVAGGVTGAGSAAGSASSGSAASGPAAASAAPTPDADRALLARHRLARPWGKRRGVVLVRVYAVPGDLDVEEATALAGAPVAAGATLVVRAANPHLVELLLVLTAPGFVDRAAAATGVRAARLRRALRSRGVDLDRRSVGGASWTRLGRGARGYQQVVVAEAGPIRAIPLDDARRLDPDAKPGDRWEFPPLEERLPRFFDGLVGRAAYTVVGGGVLDAEAFEARRAVRTPVPLPEALRGHVAAPVRPLYAGVAHGVLVFDVPDVDAEATWRALDAVAERTGYRPVLLGAAAEARVASLGWRALEGIAEDRAASRHRGDDPEAILAGVDEVDLAEVIGPRGAHGAREPERGAWPDDPRPSGLVLTRKPIGPVTVALVPTDAAWKAPAYLPWVVASGETTPAPAAICAVARRWEARWGARIVSVRPAMVEWALTRPPTTRDEALLLATEHFHLAPEADDRPTLEGRAFDLLGAGFLLGWWE